jgi:PPOX class probable FMN-dependent enzyme
MSTLPMDSVAGTRFEEIITTEAALREVLGHPGELALRKELSYLDRHCRAFIALSPFVLVGSTDSSGKTDVTPRGDAPGFALVLDEKTLAIAERPGNRRLDTLRNVLQTARVGLLFMIPGVEETLRVNGRASIVRDAAILDRTAAHGKRPLVAMVVEVEECFMHCAKALKRSSLWDTTTWPERDALPSLAQILLDQARPKGATLAGLEAHIDESNATTLY